MIPLLSENFTKTIIDEKAGFIDAFTDDINKPGLDNHIFLMYDICKPTNKETFKRIKEFKTEGIRGYSYTKDKKLYYVYAVPIKNQSAYDYKDTTYPFFTTEDKIQIGKFWGKSDETLNKHFRNPLYLFPRFEKSILPEMATPEPLIFNNKKCTGGLTVTRAF